MSEPIARSPRDQRADELVALAKGFFGDGEDGVWPQEERLYRCVARGEAWSPEGVNMNEVKPADAAAWPRDRTLRGDRIAWLVNDRAALGHVTTRGIGIAGAKVEGEIDISFCTMAAKIALKKCHIGEGLSALSAEVGGLYLDGSKVAFLHADGIAIQGNCHLRDGFSADGEVRLLGARIEGDLDCSNGHFHAGKGKKALNADRLQAGGNVFLDEGFTSDGEVRLVGARIEGNLECHNGHFHAVMDGYALNADGLHTEGSVFLNEGFASDGAVRLLGVRIGGNLECRNGHFHAGGDGYALSADGLQAGGTVFLNRGFTSDGAVRLVGAAIKGNLSCEGSSFTSGKSGKAICAESSRIDGNVFIREGTTIAGQANFVRSTIHGGFQWHGLTDVAKTELDLDMAKIGVLYDEKASWPAKGQLHLNGCVYDDISEASPTSAKERLAWLRRMPAYSQQPYDHLAQLLDRKGYQHEARTIRIAKYEDKLLALPVFSLEAFQLRFLSLFGFGYKPLQPAAWIALIWYFSGILFTFAHLEGIIVPAKIRAMLPQSQIEGLVQVP